MSLLVVDAPTVSVVLLPRSWEGEGRARWRPEPPTPKPRRVPTPTESAVLAPAALVVGPPVVPSPAADVEASSPAGRKPKRKTAASRVGDLLLTLAALLGVLVTGITVTAHSTGLRPLVVKSGSMEPLIPTGGMILVRTIPASEIEVDDVLAVKRPDNTRVTHRVLEVVHRGATAELTLKGDANEDADPVPVTVTEAGQLVMSVPSIGRVSAFFASAKGGFVLGCIFTAVALPVLRRRTTPS